MKNKHYVYAYMDPRKPGKYEYKFGNKGRIKVKFELIYIGKGCGRRWKRQLEHASIPSFLFEKKINAIRKSGKEPIVKKIKVNMDQVSAFKLESKLIKAVGRIDLKTGSLTNLTNGEQEMAFSREIQKKKSLGLKKAWSDPSSGYNLGTLPYLKSEKHKENVKKTWEIRLSDPEELKRISDRSKKAWNVDRKKEHSARIKELWKDKEWRSKTLESRKKSYTDTRRKNISIKSKNMWKDKEKRKEIMEKRKAAISLPEYKEKQRKNMQERWKNPDFRDKMEKVYSQMRK